MPVKMFSALLVLFSLQAFGQEVDYFKNNFEEARAQFLTSIDRIKAAKIFTVQQGAFPDPGDSSLETNWALLKNPEATKNLLVLVSGTHGIEGHVGSALQNWYLNDLLQRPPASDFLFIHALNPFGFKMNRRVTRNFVDLNRNFVLDPQDFKFENPAYAQINSFLNPTVPAELNAWNRYSFIFSSLKLIFQHSLESLRQAILIGQYQFPKGLFYGGQDFEYQKKIVDQLFDRTAQDYENIIVVDLHTGYGKKNKLHILANSKNQPSAPKLKQIFLEDRIDFGDQKKFYKVTGDLINYLEARSTPQRQIAGVVFELGTLNSQKTLGSIESLRRMVLENQKFHFFSNSTKMDQEIDILYSNQFNPQDPEFRQTALQQISVELKKIEVYLKK